MITSTVDKSYIRLPAWLLTFQPLIWIATVVVALTSIFDAGSLLYWTPSTMASHQTAWIVFYILMLLGTLLGTIPIMLVTRTLTATRANVFARIAFVCSIITLGFGLAYIALRFSVINFTDPTLGDALAFKLTGMPIGNAFDLFEYLTTAAIGICLWQTKLSRRMGLIIFVLSVLLIPLGLNKPPFVISLLWLAIGITLLRSYPTLRAGMIDNLHLQV